MEILGQSCDSARKLFTRLPELASAFVASGPGLELAWRRTVEPMPATNCDQLIDEMRPVRQWRQLAGFLSGRHL